MNLREGRIGNQEAILIVVLISVIGGVFVINDGQAYQSGNQTYLSILTSAALSLAVFLLAAKAMARRGASDLFALLTDSFGSFLGGLFGLIVSLLLVVAAAMPLIRILLILHRYIYVDADLALIAVYFLAVLLVLTLYGLETLGRLAKLLFVPVLLAFLIVLLLAIPVYEGYRLYPLLGGGTETFIGEVLRGMTSFLPSLLLLLICGRGVHGAPNAAKLGCIAALASGLLCAAVQFCMGLTFSYKELGAMYAPLYRMTMSIRVAARLRMDKVLLFCWVIGALLGTAALLYAASLQFSRCFRLRDVRPASAAFSGLAVSIVLLGHFNTVWMEQTAAMFMQYQWIALTAPLLAASAVGLCKKENRLCRSAA